MTEDSKDKKTSPTLSQPTSTPLSIPDVTKTNFSANNITVVALVFAGAVTIAEGPGDPTFVETLIGTTMLIILFAFYRQDNERWYENLAFSATFSFILMITIAILIDQLEKHYLKPPNDQLKSIPYFIFWLVTLALCFLTRFFLNRKALNKS